jgi:hypothetical protein
LSYEPVAAFDAPEGLTEATLRFGDADGDARGGGDGGGGVLRVLHRRDGGTATALLGTSSPPYKDWAWRDTGFQLGGPEMIRHRGRWYAAGRWTVGKPKTVLARVSWKRGTLEPILELESGGDTSYPGLASSGMELWMSYYSSHEGKTSIYLARIGIE